MHGLGDGFEHPGGLAHATDPAAEIDQLLHARVGPRLVPAGKELEREGAVLEFRAPGARARTFSESIVVFLEPAGHFRGLEKALNGVVRGVDVVRHAETSLGNAIALKVCLSGRSIQIPVLEPGGYVRMSEKSRSRVISILSSAMHA